MLAVSSICRRSAGAKSCAVAGWYAKNNRLSNQVIEANAYMIIGCLSKIQKLFNEPNALPASYLLDVD
ncbi:hypothetical protein [Hymenobacter ginkgonis]|uniref:hypothetical protein n=1 Tax=Hymenobacter ginkgonis TaxID=2682976 RepID=UPI0018DE8C73|nr:hypothetical protein [Hymenobacter ginkgonis]